MRVSWLLKCHDWPLNSSLWNPSKTSSKLTSMALIATTPTATVATPPARSARASSRRARTAAIASATTTTSSNTSRRQSHARTSRMWRSSFAVNARRPFGRRGFSSNETDCPRSGSTERKPSTASSVRSFWFSTSSGARCGYVARTYVSVSSTRIAFAVKKIGSATAATAVATLAARMGAIVDPPQALAVDVAVHLRGRERRVPEQLLDDAQIGSALQQVRRERVTEAMRVRNQAPQRRRIEPPAAHGHEQRALAAAHELGPPVPQVLRDPPRRLLAERDDAVLGALPLAHVHELLLEVDVGDVERHRLGASQPRRVDELHQRAVAQRERAVAARELLEQIVDVARLRRLGQAAAAARREWRVGHATRPEREPEQRAKRCELARDRRRRELSAGSSPAELRYPVGEDAHVDRFDVAVAVPCGEFAQVVAVRAARPVRDSRGRQEAVDGGVDRHAPRFAARLRSPADGRALRSPRRSRRPRRERAAGASGRRERVPGAGTARARGRRRRVRARRAVRRRPVLRPAGEACADRACRLGDARLRAVVVRRAPERVWRPPRGADQPRRDHPPRRTRRSRSGARGTGPAALCEGGSKDRRRPNDELDDRPVRASC